MLTHIVPLSTDTQAHHVLGDCLVIAQRFLSLDFLAPRTRMPRCAAQKCVITFGEHKHLPTRGTRWTGVECSACPRSCRVTRHSLCCFTVLETPARCGVQQSNNPRNGNLHFRTFFPVQALNELEYPEKLQRLLLTPQREMTVELVSVINEHRCCLLGPHLAVTCM